VYENTSVPKKFSFGVYIAVLFTSTTFETTPFVVLKVPSLLSVNSGNVKLNSL